MRDGFSVLQETLKTTKYPDIFALMRDAGIALVKTMGGASGVIFGTMFIAGHEGVRDRTQMDARELVEFFRAGAASIAKRGRTSPGDKTMLDALLPAVDAWSKPVPRPKTWSRCWRLLIRGPWMGRGYEEYAVPKREVQKFPGKNLGHTGPWRGFGIPDLQRHV